MTQTEAQRRATRESHKRRRERGMKQVTVWMEPDVLEVLYRMRDAYGSKDAAIAAGLRALEQLGSGAEGQTCNNS